MTFFAYRAAVNKALSYRGKPRAPEQDISRAWRAKLTVSDAAILISMRVAA